MPQANAAAVGSIDLEPLRAAVTIADVLNAAGIDVPTRGRRIACPIHGGTNTSAFSFTDERWYCFNCGAGGDVFALAQQLRGGDFKQAAQFVAHLAGLDVGAMPRALPDEVERRTKLRRRRQALRKWRDRRLDRLIASIRRLTEEVDSLHKQLTHARARADEQLEASCWSALDTRHAELAAVEWWAAQLETRDEQSWAGLWLQSPEVQLA